MIFLIGLILILNPKSTLAWDLTLPQFAPAWVNTNLRSEIRQLKGRIKFQPDAALNYARLSELYLIKKQFKQSRRFIDLANFKGLRSPYYYLCMGRLLDAQEKYKQAENYLFKGLLESQQEHPEYFFYFAAHLFKRNLYHRAAHWLQLGLKLHPTNPQLLILLGYTFLLTQDFESAEIVLIDSRKKHPPFDSIISFNLAKMYALIQNWDSSIYNLRRSTIKGFRHPDKILMESSFKAFENHPQFQLLLNESRNNQEKFLNQNKFRRI